MPDTQVVATDCDHEARFDGKRLWTPATTASSGSTTNSTAAAWIELRRAERPDLTRAEDKEDGEGWGLYLVNGRFQVNLIKRKLDDSMRIETKNAIPDRPASRRDDVRRLAHGHGRPDLCRRPVAAARNYPRCH